VPSEKRELVENYENYNYRLKPAGELKTETRSTNWQPTGRPPDIIAKASSRLLSEHFNTVAAAAASSRWDFLWPVAAKTNQLNNVASIRNRSP